MFIAYLKIGGNSYLTSRSKFWSPVSRGVRSIDAASAAISVISVDSCGGVVGGAMASTGCVVPSDDGKSCKEVRLFFHEK